MSSANGATPDRVGVYMRVSTEIQRRRGTIETQRPDLDRYLAYQNLKPYAWYEDIAVSGHWTPFGERPQGKRLLADIAAGHVNLVVIWRLDRFGRDAREIHNAVHDLEVAGARLYSLHESFDTRQPAGKLMLGVLASVAEFEWASIAERSAAGVERKLSDGAWMGGPVPYGLRVEGRGTTARLVYDEEPLGIPDHPDLTAADVVRLIYRLLLDERKSTIEIADTLNQMGVPTSYERRGRTYRRRGQVGPEQHVWRASTVRTIIRNPVYRGVYTFGRRSLHHAGREIVTSAVPGLALVSTETWEAAQTQLRANLRFGVRDAVYDYLLKGLIRCGHCGHLYIGDAHETGPRYVCYNHRRPMVLWGDSKLAEQRRCRDSLPVKAKQIERDVWAKVEHYLRHPDEALDDLALLLHGHASAAHDLRAQIAAVQRELDARQIERDTVLTYHAKGRMSERDLDRQMDRVAGEERELSAQVAALTAQLGEADEIAGKLSAAAALLAELRDKLDTAPPTKETKRAIIEKLIEYIVVRTEVDAGTQRRRPAIYVKAWFDPEPVADADAQKSGYSTNTLMHGRTPGRDSRSSETASAAGRD
jgi:site-specific DNA recombinase